MTTASTPGRAFEEHRPATAPRSAATFGPIDARRTLFTHMTHDLPHAATCAALPAGVSLAHDGLDLEVPLAATDHLLVAGRAAAGLLLSGFGVCRRAPQRDVA